MYQIIGKEKGIFIPKDSQEERVFYALYVTLPMIEQSGKKETFGRRTDRLKCTEALYHLISPSDFGQDLNIFFDRYGRAVQLDFGS